MTFEDYLKDLHGLNYMGTDDDMPDKFEAWLSKLDVDEIIKCVNDYINIQTIEVKKVIDQNYQDIMNILK
jgi:hypothetical protein